MQKIHLIILILLLVFTGLSAHKQLMHQHITREAFELLKMSFPANFTGFNEMEEFLGHDETDETSFNPNLFYSIGERKIVAGAWYEDEFDNVYHYGLLRTPNYNDLPGWVEDMVIGGLDSNIDMHSTITHFWNVDGGEGCSTYLDDTINGDVGSYHWDFTISANAMKKIRKYATGNYDLRMYYDNPIAWPHYDNCIMNDFTVPSLVEMYHGQGEMTSFRYYHQLEEWYDCDSPTMQFSDHNRVGLTYNLLGRMCHLLQDMTVPAHVHCTSHAGIHGMYSDHFEEHEMDYLENYYYWNASRVFNNVGRFLDPYIHDDPLYYLMYVSAQIADYFADGKKNGDSDYDHSISGLVDMMSLLDGPVLSSEIDDETCRDIYDQVIPQAIRATAGLLYWFAVETGQIEPIPHPWSVSGNVQIADGSSPVGVKIKFICENGENFNTYVDENGSYSKIFNYENTGIYEVVFQKEGFYPINRENIEISEELVLDEALMSPILSNGFVQVSRDLDYPGFYHIQDAVDYMQYQSDGVIILREGTYTGSKNKNIHWYPSSFTEPNTSVHLHICAPAGHQVVIDCENSGCAFLFDEEELGFGHHYNENDVIDNITIINAEQGIIIRNGSPKIVNNTIENCHDYAYSYNTNGVGISCYSSAIIQGNTIRNNIGDWVGLSPEQSTLGGGIYVENLSNDPVIIWNNTIENCKAQEGGGIYVVGPGNVEIRENILRGNSLVFGQMSDDYPGEATALYVQNCEDVDIIDNLIIRNEKPELCGDNVVFVAAVDDLEFRNNTVACNTGMKGIKLVNNDLTKIKNSIFYENQRGIYCLGGSNTIVDYCCMYGNSFSNYLGNAVERDCFYEDPKLVDPDNDDFTPIWDETLLSLMIDRGDQDYYDVDQTGSDIGSENVIWHDHHITDLNNNYFGGRYRWVCFPVLDREITQGATLLSYVFNQYVTENYGFIDFIGAREGSSWYNNWSNESLELYSTKGYKVFSEAGEKLSISGQKIADDTVVDLKVDERNWVGYFVKKPMSVQNALSSIWDHVISVASEDWFIAKDGYYPEERCCMIYGKMYIIKVDEDCQLCYTDGQEIDPKEREIPEVFVYNEKEDYTPIVITGIDDPDITEVGILLDGECIGATKVEEYPLQILAYPDDQLRGEGDISFQLYTANRKFKEVEKYSIYSEKEGNWITGNPVLNPYQMQIISFGEIPEKPRNHLIQNYPNPFNPNTYIDYSIAEAGNVNVTIFNIKGQRVKTLIDEFQASGTHKLAWNGEDEAGRKVTSGVYFYQIKSGNYSSIKKMLLIK